MFWNKKKDNEEENFVLKLVLNCELDKIKKWNEETFPEATLGGQLEKLEEEINELCNAKELEDQKKELADVFIVLGGLRRWESKIGNMQEVRLTETMPAAVLAELLMNIHKKMEINRKRVWKKSGNGKFHHEEVKKK